MSEYQYNTDNVERICVQYGGLSNFNQRPLFICYVETNTGPNNSWVEVPGTRQFRQLHSVKHMIVNQWDAVIRLEEEDAGLLQPMITEEGSD